MNWKGKKKFLIGLLSIAVLCGNMDVSAQREHLEQDVTEGLRISADVSVPENFQKESVKVADVKRRLFTLEEAKELLWGNREIDKALSEDSYEQADLGNYSIDTVYGKDGSFLDVGGASLFYYTALYPYIERSIVTDPALPSYNMDKFQKEDLAFLGRTECLEKVKELLAQFDISVAEKVQCYSLDYQTLQREEETRDINDTPHPEEAKPEWTEEDECYYFRFQQEYDSIEIYGNGYGDYITGNGYPATAIEVIYGREGVVYLRIQNVYQTIKEREEKLAFNQTDGLIKALKNKYDLLITTQTDTVTDIQLLYAPCDSGNHEVTLLPTWIVQVETPMEETESYFSTILIESVTGKELY